MKEPPGYQGRVRRLGGTGAPTPVRDEQSGKAAIMTLSKLLARTGALLSGLAAVLVLATTARADPESEQALIDLANGQLAVVLDVGASKEDRIAALRKLKSVHDRIKRFAAADPAYASRSDTDELRKLNEDTGDFLTAEASRLGIDLDAAAPAEEPVSGEDDPCKGIPLPDYSGHHGRLERAARGVAQAFRELEAILDEPASEEIDGAILDRRNRRDRALEALVRRQVRLAGDAADETSEIKLARIAMLEARELFLVHLREKGAADSEGAATIRRVEEIHRQFNKSKEEWASGGKTPPNLLQLEAEALRLIKKIHALREVSHQAHMDYCAVAEPMEDTAK